MQPKKTKTGKTPGNTGSKQTAGGSGQVKVSSKNSRENFMKKLQICQKNFDYNDESKDVQGKTERLNAINEI